MRNLCNAILQANIFSRLPIVEIPKHSWWTSSALSGSEGLMRQQSRKDTDDRSKKGKSIFGISFGKDVKDKKSASSDSKP